MRSILGRGQVVHQFPDVNLRLELLERQMLEQNLAFEARVCHLERQLDEKVDAAAVARENIVNTALGSCSHEISRCRDLCAGTIFLLGFARSSTSITAQILNSSKRIFLLGEANLYLPHPEKRFRDWYNEMHLKVNNQVSKTTYAPDLVPEVDHDWLDWLSAASKVYPLVGDKMAFSAIQFSMVDPSKIRSFFESRFILSKYVFTIREPTQTLLSTAKLFAIMDDGGIIKEIIAWLRFIQMWADWVRIFPNTLTFIAEELGKNTLNGLQDFLEIDLSGAELFIDEGNRTKHQNLDAFPILAQIQDELKKVFDLVRVALNHNPIQWQLTGALRADQSADRDAKLNPVHLSKTPIYSAWAMCEELIQNLQQDQLS